MWQVFVAEALGAGSPEWCREMSDLWDAMQDEEAGA